jgi:biotin carboxyl carrier protein
MTNRNRIKGVFVPALSVVIVICAFLLIRITGDDPGTSATSQVTLSETESLTTLQNSKEVMLYFFPENPAPGDFLVIETALLENNLPVILQFNFPGSCSFQYRVADNFYAVIGISYDTTPGEYELSILSDEASAQTILTKALVSIGEKDFQVSYFNVPPSATAGWTAERLAEDREKVRIARETSELQPLWLQKFIMPLEARISSEYAAIRHINNNLPRRHNGIDLAADEGTPVVAPNSGMVRLAEHLLSGGNTVIIDHGLNISSTYMHLNTIDVTVGEEVKRGQQLGTVGMTGYANGPHLHWEVNIGQFPVNPLQLLDNDLLWIPPAYVQEMLEN